MTAPIIVTAHLDESSFTVLDVLRRRYFPQKLNKIPAHVSLFHQLPGSELDVIDAAVARCCRGRKSFDLEPGEVRFLGRGVALGYRSLELGRLHGELATEWQDWLTPQDRQRFKAHVTIQNKVESSVARALHSELARVPPPPCRVEGVTLWRYLDGPWEHIETHKFTT